MKWRNQSFAVVCLSFTGFLVPPPTVTAQDADNKPPILAAAQSSKQKYINACRARYRDCLKLNQIPAFECQYIYEDCLRHIT
jgi:hypothetical protein